jgi:hypothetical protein
MNRTSDKYWVGPTLIPDYKAEDCLHNHPVDQIKVFIPYGHAVRRIIKFCTNCGLIVDGL